jgi:hypothetical protein
MLRRKRAATVAGYPRTVTFLQIPPQKFGGLGVGCLQPLRHHGTFIVTNVLIGLVLLADREELQLAHRLEERRGISSDLNNAGARAMLCARTDIRGLTPGLQDRNTRTKMLIGAAPARVQQAARQTSVTENKCDRKFGGRTDNE